MAIIRPIQLLRGISNQSVQSTIAGSTYTFELRYNTVKELFDVCITRAGVEYQVTAVKGYNLITQWRSEFSGIQGIYVISTDGIEETELTINTIGNEGILIVIQEE